MTDISEIEWCDKNRAELERNFIEDHKEEFKEFASNEFKAYERLKSGHYKD